MRRIVIRAVAILMVVFCAACTERVVTTPDMSKDLFIVTHIDVMPTYSNAAYAAIQTYAQESRKEPGAVSVEGLVQDGRTNHFTIVEVWQSREALASHGGEAHTKEFRDKLQPMLGAPFDERLHEPIP